MNFTKVTLSLVMICSVAQGSMQKQHNDRNRYCSSVSNAVTTVAIFSLALVGWTEANAASGHRPQPVAFEAARYKSCEKFAQDLSDNLGGCVKKCNQPDLACYDICAKQVFANAQEVEGCKKSESVVSWILSHHDTCKNLWVKTENDGTYKIGSDGEHIDLNSKECALGIVEWVKDDIHKESQIFAIKKANSGRSKYYRAWAENFNNNAREVGNLLKRMWDDAA